MRATIYKADGTKENRDMTSDEAISWFGSVQIKKLIGSSLYYDPSATEDNPHFAQAITLEDGTPSFAYPYKGDVIALADLTIP